MALSADANIVQLTGKTRALPADASSTTYRGSMCSLRSDEYVGPLAAGELFVGHATAKADNSSGSNGAINVELLGAEGPYELEVTLTSVAVTDVGKDVYATDDATLTLTRSGTRVGRVVRYVGTNTCVVLFEPFVINLEPIVQEFDCETGVDTAAKTLLYASQNPTGLLIKEIYGRVTEVFGGASEDQGIITVRDTVPNTLATLTPSDAGADAAGDIIVGYAAAAASTGAATKTVAPGVGIEAIVTQATSGAGAAGKAKVYIAFQPLA